MFHLAWTVSPTHSNFHFRLSSQFRLQHYFKTDHIYGSKKKFPSNISVHMRTQTLFFMKMH